MSKTLRQYEALLKENTEVKDASANEKAALERQIRDIQETRRLLEEEVEDLKSEKEESIRSIERKATELEARNESLQTTVRELQQDSDQREAMLQDVQQKVADRDLTVGNLEAEVLRLKAQTGDVETLDVIKRELSEQVTHIRKLEVINREQAAELKHFKRLHKSVEVVEEEKRSLQRKLEAVEGLENELGEARIQRQRLEDERLAWTAYLQSQASEDGRLEFETPEALARGLIAERLQTATLFERIGALEPEISARDNTIQSLEAERTKLLDELEKVKSSGTSASNSKVQLRLERQRDLAVREADFLRAQLKTYDTEDTTFQPEKVDEAKQQRIEELEKLLENYKTEVQSLTVEIASKEGLSPPAPGAGSKHPRDNEEENERIGELTRKKRKLQDEVTMLQTNNKLFQKEISVLQERLAAATKPRETRVLSLRSNPTSDYEAIKMTTITALRKENADLLARLQGSLGENLTQVPISVLESMNLEVTAAKDALKSEKTRNARLLKQWGGISNQFREAVSFLFGWDMVFMKEGKVRVTSTFYPGKEDDENFIVFDMQIGTMKVSGGPQSAFAFKIADQRSFWLGQQKSSIPCFLSALTMEFWEEANRDKTARIDV